LGLGLIDKVKVAGAERGARRTRGSGGVLSSRSGDTVERLCKCAGCVVKVRVGRPLLYVLETGSPLNLVIITYFNTHVLPARTDFNVFLTLFLSSISVLNWQFNSVSRLDAGEIN
jgi:hypothetical protein